MGLNCYLDVPGFLAAQPALPLTGLLGGSSTLATAALVGATTLTMASNGSVMGSPGFQPSALLYILDGAQSEMITLASVSGVILTLGANQIVPTAGSATAYAHAAGVSVSTGSTLGALGDTLLAASSWAEEYCQQGSPQDRGFFSATRTERIPMPTSRAYIDRSYGLVVRPHWYPLTALSAVSIEYAPGTGTAFNPSLAEFDTGGMFVKVPQLTPVSSGYPTLGGFSFYNRGADMWAALTYTAGFAPTALPWNFRRAISFAAREFLAYAQNPTGAAMVAQGDVKIMARMRGSAGKESSSDMLFLAQAKVLLTPYRANPV